MKLLPCGGGGGDDCSGGGGGDCSGGGRWVGL